MEVVNTVGRRKAAVARVYVKPGKGQITINRKALEVYFPLEILQYQVKQPLLATKTVENYAIDGDEDVVIKHREGSQKRLKQQKKEKIKKDLN